ncbi:MAG TPA: hypothetical protein PLN41_06060 [Methanothrix sp.]|nr:hypothetical protein [Methanothrix sp.]
MNNSLPLLFNSSGESANRIPPIILGNFEEVVGPLDHIVPADGHLEAKIGRCLVALPEDLYDELLPLVGLRVGIIRTDTSRPYRFRVVRR